MKDRERVGCFFDQRLECSTDCELYGWAKSLQDRTRQAMRRMGIDPAAIETAEERAAGGFNLLNSFHSTVMKIRHRDKINMCTRLGGDDTS